MNPPKSALEFLQFMGYFLLGGMILVVVCAVIGASIAAITGSSSM